MPDNPFLDPAFHIRWAALTPDLVEPSIDEAIARAESALQAIESAVGEPTFEGTFLALDEASDALDRAWGRVTHLQSVADSPKLREAHNKALPKVSAFAARIPLRPALWDRLKAFSRTSAAERLSPVRERFMSETLAEFREAGADLPPEGRARLEAIQAELAQVTQRYSENVLDATNAWQLIVEDESRLAGLPAHAKARALAEAVAKGLASADRPAWRFTLHMPSLRAAHDVPRGRRAPKRGVACRLLGRRRGAARQHGAHRRDPQAQGREGAPPWEGAFRGSCPCEEDGEVG